MKHLILTISLVLFANTVAATTLSIKHNKKLPTPHDLITKGKILEKWMPQKGDGFRYWIAWDKTDDIYLCGISKEAVCYLLEQSTTVLTQEK